MEGANQKLNGSSSRHERNSDSFTINLSYNAFYNFLTCKNLDLKQYRVLLLFTFALNTVSLVMESIHTVVVFLDCDLAMGVVSVFATILTIINCTIVLKIMAYPSTRLALVSSAIILVLEVVYITQCIVEADSIIHETIVILLTAAILAMHLATAFILYRYWEFVMYHYDESNGLQNFVNNLPSGSFISPNDVASQLRSPLVEDDGENDEA